MRSRADTLLASHETQSHRPAALTPVTPEDLMSSPLKESWQMGQVTASIMATSTVLTLKSCTCAECSKHVMSACTNWHLPLAD